MSRLLPLFVLCVLLFAPRVQAAEAPDPAASARPSLDVEVDPVAYALSGYSVHAGVRHGPFRWDIGAFGLSAPESFRSNPSIEERHDGFGFKLDYRFTDGRFVPFAGPSLSHSRLALRNADTGVTIALQQTAPTLRVGLEMNLVWGFYVTPWVSLGYTLQTEVRNVDGELYDRSPWRVFPTIHLGWRP